MILDEDEIDAWLEDLGVGIYLWISMFVNLIQRKKQTVNIEPKSVTGLTNVQSSINYHYFVGFPLIFL